jgi:hypothetical protein
MTRDESKYKDANRSISERFLDAGGKPKNDFVFGRRLVPTMTMSWFFVLIIHDRICIGRFFASATVWHTFVSLLAVFDILPGRGWDGKDIDITEYEHAGGAIR